MVGGLGCTRGTSTEPGQAIEMNQLVTSIASEASQSGLGMERAWYKHDKMTGRDIGYLGLKGGEPATLKTQEGVIS